MYKLFINGYACIVKTFNNMFTKSVGEDMTNKDHLYVRQVFVD